MSSLGQRSATLGARPPRQKLSLSEPETGPSFGVRLAVVPSDDGGEVELCELFDPSDIVDRWVFMLAGVVADLATMESVFKAALHGDDAPPAHRYYLQRQLGTRIVEADRVVLAIPGNPAIQRFVKAVGADEEAEWLVS
jgi:hypothetical protein